MGLIILDNIQLGNGLSVVNAYTSFGTNKIILQKNLEGNYDIASSALVWVNKQARDDGLQAVASYPCTATLTGQELSSNLYGALYTDLKSKFVSIIDA